MPLTSSRTRALVALLGAALLLALGLGINESPVDAAVHTTARPSIAFIAHPGGDVTKPLQAFWRSAGGGPIQQLTADTKHEAQWITLASNDKFAIIAKSVSFVDSGDEDLYRLNTTTKTVKDISNLEGQELYPELSPDRKLVAFHRVVPTTPGLDAIQVMNLATGELTTVSSIDRQKDGIPDFAASWSHDGSRLAYSTSDGLSDLTRLVVADASGSTHNVIQSLAGVSQFGPCAWTPDDAYVLCPELASEQIFAINVVTGASAQITNDPTARMYGAAVGNDWTMYYTAAGADGAVHMRQTWLGDLSTYQLGFKATTEGTTQPAIGNTGALQPAPAGFPPIDPPRPPSPPSTPVDCPRLRLFGLRGSRDNEQDHAVSDFMLNRFAAELSAHIKGVDFVPLKYPAVPIGYGGLSQYTDWYLDSFIKGMNTLLDHVDKFKLDCPKTPYAIVGYSQGAQAVGDALVALQPGAQDQLLGVALFGDPAFNPQQPSVDVGTYDPKLKGIWAALPYSPLHHYKKFLLDDIRSYCVEGDPICNFKVGHLKNCELHPKRCAHLDYRQDGLVGTAALRLVRAFRGTR